MSEKTHPLIRGSCMPRLDARRTPFNDSEIDNLHVKALTNECYTMEIYSLIYKLTWMWKICHAFVCVLYETPSIKCFLVNRKFLKTALFWTESYQNNLIKRHFEQNLDRNICIYIHILLSKLKLTKTFMSTSQNA